MATETEPKHPLGWIADVWYYMVSMLIFICALTGAYYWVYYFVYLFHQ